MSASLQEGNVGATAACDFARVKFSSAQLRISLPSIFTYLYIVLYHNIQIVQYRMMRLIRFFPSPKIICSPPIDQKVLTLYNRYRKPCERGGIGRRTGFRILRLVHGGSSPFVRTKKSTVDLTVLFYWQSPFSLKPISQKFTVFP